MTMVVEELKATKDQSYTVKIYKDAPGSFVLAAHYSKEVLT